MFNMFNTMPSHNTEPGRRCYTDARADNGALATRRQCGPDLRRSRAMVPSGSFDGRWAACAGGARFA
jgi:hypothetical protein